MRIPKCPNKSSYTIAPFSWTNVHRRMFHCVVNNCTVLSFLFFLSRSFLFIVSIQFISFHVISSRFIHPTNQQINQSINQLTHHHQLACGPSITINGHHESWVIIMSHQLVRSGSHDWKNSLCHHTIETQPLKLRGLIEFNVQFANAEISGSRAPHLIQSPGQTKYYSTVHWKKSCHTLSLAPTPRFIRQVFKSTRHGLAAWLDSWLESQPLTLK